MFPVNKNLLTRTVLVNNLFLNLKSNAEILSSLLSWLTWPKTLQASWVCLILISCLSLYSPVNCQLSSQWSALNLTITFLLIALKILELFLVLLATTHVRLQILFTLMLNVFMARADRQSTSYRYWKLWHTKGRHQNKKLKLELHSRFPL